MVHVRIYSVGFLLGRGHTGVYMHNDNLHDPNHTCRKKEKKEQQDGTRVVAGARLDRNSLTHSVQKYCGYNWAGIRGRSRCFQGMVVVCEFLACVAVWFGQNPLDFSPGRRPDSNEERTSTHAPTIP